MIQKSLISRFSMLLVMGAIFCLPNFSSTSLGQSQGSMRVYFSPNGGAEEAIIKEIRKSKKEILVAIFQFTSRPIGTALVQAKSRGVKVVVLVDGKNKNVSYSQIPYLVKKGIEVRYVYPKSSSFDSRTAKFHHKYMIIDQKEVLTGSFNYTRAADQINHENLLVIYSKKLAKAYRKNFVSIYNNKKITKTGSSRFKPSYGRVK